MENKRRADKSFQADRPPPFCLPLVNFRHSAENHFTLESPGSGKGMIAACVPVVGSGTEKGRPKNKAKDRMGGTEASPGIPFQLKETVFT